MKRVCSLLIVVAVLLTMIPANILVAQAATTSSYAPYAKIETGYSDTVTYGTVRYMSQISSSSYFYSAYWGNWVSQASIECGTCCISMALSYVGINKTPDDILDAGSGTTYFGSKWGGASVYSYTATDIQSAVNNYVNGNGKYSPPIIHLDNYSSAGHFVVVIGRVSDDVYQVIDPGNSKVHWTMTISGTNATYYHPKTGSYISDSIDRSGRTDDIYQYYNASALICSHDSYDSLGVCSSCGAVYDWESTFSTDCMGTYEVTNTFTPRTDAPYDAATKASYQIAAGAYVEVLGRIENAFGNTWYNFTDANGRTGYVYESYLEFDSYSDFEVVCNDFSPANMATVEQKAQPVLGTVVSNYPIAAIYASLDGSNYASWTASNQSTTEVNLRSTDINLNLAFGSLAEGKHTVTLYATSFVHDNTIKFHESVFYVSVNGSTSTIPGKPVLNTSFAGDCVTFTWEDTVNTTHYNLWIDRKGADGNWENVERIFYAENGLSRTLSAGEYRAQLLSYNSNDWEPDNSDWLHTWADDVFFTIETELVITKQPTNASAFIGSGVATTVEAAGDGLTYAWYVKEPGSSSFVKSAAREAQYSYLMTKEKAGRQVYCVITDQYGNSVTTNTVTLSGKFKAEIITQPTDASAYIGSGVGTTVVAEGDGLTYTWYVKEPGSSSFVKSAASQAKYSFVLTEAKVGRQVYCVITDRYGNSVTTNTVTFSKRTALKITQQPNDDSSVIGSGVHARVKAEGDGLTYAWYVKEPGSTSFVKSANRTALYGYTLTADKVGRQVYCVVTDQYGVSVTTNTVTFSLKTEIIVSEGETAKLSISAEGSLLTYKWNMPTRAKALSGIHRPLAATVTVLP